jgi:CheY-like chemotaxis protein
VLGSGLGLATVFSIIRQHEGYIQVESELGEGTCFTLYLPASKSTQPLSKETISDPARTVPVSTGRILLMDDDPAIRYTVSRLLTHLGYSCEVAADGLEALHLYREALTSKSPFTAVIVDLTVPDGMGGEETVRHILKNDPNAKVIVSSGYSEDPIMANFRKYGFSGIVSKPYQLKELQQVLAEVVGKA